MLKYLVLAAFPLAVSAQTCDLEGTVTVSHNGQVEARFVSSFYRLPTAEADKMHDRALKVVDVASKVQDKRGQHMVEFDEVRNCNGIKTRGNGVAGVMVQGVTLAGATKVSREFEKQMSESTREQEQRAAKGKHRAFGRD